MKINLKKAASIQEDIRSYIKDLMDFINKSASSKITLFEDVEEEYFQRYDDVKEAYEKAVKAIDILTGIRLKLSEANQDSGISARLVAMNGLTNKERLLLRFTNLEPSIELQALKEHQEHLKSLKEDSYGRTRTIDLNVLDKEYLKDKEKELKRIRSSIRVIKDSMLELNHQNYIELEPDKIEFLKEHFII